MPRLKSVLVRGFRSIKEMNLELGPINVCIGANGAGKSNLIEFFKMVNEMMAGRLQQYIATTGRATANLHFGPQVTQQLEAELTFEADQGTNTYYVRLFYAAGDSLVFADESLSFLRFGNDIPQQQTFGAGHQEALIRHFAENQPLINTLRNFLNHCRVYHFHDTSQSARIRRYCYVGDTRWLMPDAANLAAILYQMKSNNEVIYRRIVRDITQIAPYFEDFDLEPAHPLGTDIILNWRHRQSDLVFGPHQFSDGTLRAICLIALLHQPVDDPAYLIVVDEPELGLHPHALELISSLFRAASKHAQILISTQSSTFVDTFDPRDIVVVDRTRETTTFQRPNTEVLESWLEDYSLGEVWEKNVIGGSPS
ncbi:MAG: AAA family ATPase [Spirochaetaceae bacterium]|nr:AAA family ATPase [Spirochaetaceae bacterium]